MVFSSAVFLFVFLPLTLALWVLAAGADGVLRRGPWVQNLLLLVASLAFYFYGSGDQLGLLLGVVGVTYVAGLLVGSERWGRTALGVGVSVQVAALGYFKYANFFVDQVGALSGLVGGPAVTMAAVALPVGISFFTFQAISYLFDIYRREQQPLRSPLDLALYISMFPQLIAGPIVRYGEVARQLHDRPLTRSLVATGAVRFIWGLFKKLVIADSVATIADAAYGLPVEALTTPAAWLGALAYALQIYFDFSAYSDIAIGLGRMFGFRFPENFRRPYSAESITDFWRRWHMTLSFWFRDYVYIPLGGSKASRWSTYRNLWAVFLLSGLWHGAAWTFVFWGAFHGGLLTLERMWRGRKAPRLPVALRRARTFALVVLGFAMFRADTMSQTLALWQHIFVPSDLTVPVEVAITLSHKNVGILLLGLLTTALPGRFVTGRWLTEGKLDAGLPRLVRWGVLVGGAFLASLTLASSDFSPFIYFRF